MRDISDGEKFDLLYLHIEIPYLNGIALAKKVRERDVNILIIYISSNEKYLRELFEVEPFRFIKKPVDEKLFRQYFEKAYERIQQGAHYFAYQFKRAVYKVAVEDILFFESRGRVIIVHATNGKGRFYGRMNQIEKQLQSGKTCFLRIHQSYLVNFRFIEKLSYGRVVLTNRVELQISEKRRKVIRTQYKELLEGELFDE